MSQNIVLIFSKHLKIVKTILSLWTIQKQMAKINKTHRYRQQYGVYQRRKGTGVEGGDGKGKGVKYTVTTEGG